MAHFSNELPLSLMQCCLTEGQQSTLMVERDDNLRKRAALDVEFVSSGGSDEK